ncbi:MAG: hypothetical protein ACRDHE_15055 [Ktedonobacterales bacterium]
MMPLHEGYAGPEPILAVSVVTFLCAAVNWSQRKAPPSLIDTFQRRRGRRNLTKIARWLAIWCVLIALGAIALYLRYRLDPEDQFSDYNVATTHQVAQIGGVALLLGLATLVMTVLLGLARLFVCLRTHREGLRAR